MLYKDSARGWRGHDNREEKERPGRSPNWWETDLRGLHDVLRQCESEEVGEDTDKLLPVLLPEQVVDRTQAFTLKISGAQLSWPWI